MKNNTLKHGLIALLTGALAACQSTSQNSHSLINPDTLHTTPLGFSQQQLGKQALPLTHNQQPYWLTTSTSEGLRLFDQQGQVVMQQAGNFEVLSLRSRAANQQQDWLATLDVNTDSVAVWTIDWQNKGFTPVTQLPTIQAQTETLCWYQANRQLHLFTADTQGMVRQYWVDEHGVTPVREFIGVPNITACVADDQKQALYLAEEGIGVWQYPADPEAELERQLVIATAPVGPVEGEIKGLTLLADGDLLLSAPDQAGIWRIGNQGDATLLALPGDAAPEALGANTQQDLATLVIFDDKTDQYVQATLPVSSPVPAEVSPAFTPLVAYGQTAPVAKFGDAADDPAIWVNTQQPGNSRILGTDKKQGLYVYDLQGKELQRLSVGRVNNVDVRYGFSLAGKNIDLAAASNRTSNGITLFSIAPDTGKVKPLTTIATDLSDIYGLCMAKLGNDYFVYVNDTDGRFQQYQLTAKDKQVSGHLVREFQVASQPEGCVVDEQSNQLYYGEEEAGIWQVNALPKATEHKMIAGLGGNLVADIEGLAIYRLAGKAYLIASVQGNNSYAVFALPDNRYLGSFAIGVNRKAGIDGVSETDGLEALSTPLGNALPDGLMVVQDGRNNLPMAPQNFKLVDGRQLRKFIADRK